MKRWNGIQVTSLLTERAPGMIAGSNQGLCSLNVRRETNLDTILGEQGVQEMEGYR